MGAAAESQKDALLRQVADLDEAARDRMGDYEAARAKLAGAIREAASEATVREIAERCSLGRSRVGQIVKGDAS